MSQWSEKIPKENLSKTVTSTRYLRRFATSFSEVWIQITNFRKSSKKFIIDLLTKNVALNLSGAIFFVGLGYSLKWWYKDQLFVVLLKQNLPALSESQQNIFWETDESILNDESQIMLGKEEKSEIVLCKEKEYQTWTPVIDRIDLYANHIRVKFKQPWQKHASERFLGVFGEPAQVNVSKQLLTIPFTGEKDWLKENTSIINNSLLTQLNFYPYGVKRVQRDASSAALSGLPRKVVQPTKMNVLGYRRYASSAQVVSKNNIVNKFSTYTFYTPKKPIFSKKWFKLSPRNLCFLNQEVSLLPLGTKERSFFSKERVSLAPSLLAQRCQVQCYTSSAKQMADLLPKGQRSVNAALPEKRNTVVKVNPSWGLWRSEAGEERYFSRSQTLTDKFSYPLQLTKKLAGWQPFANLLILNSHLDEIPYKLENALQSYFPKKNSQLLFLSTSFRTSINSLTPFRGRLASNLSEYANSLQPRQGNAINDLAIKNNSVNTFFCKASDFDLFDLQVKTFTHYLPGLRSWQIKPLPVQSLALQYMQNKERFAQLRDQEQKSQKLIEELAQRWRHYPSQKPAAHAFPGILAQRDSDGAFTPSESAAGFCEGYAPGGGDKEVNRLLLNQESQIVQNKKEESKIALPKEEEKVQIADVYDLLLQQHEELVIEELEAKDTCVKGSLLYKLKNSWVDDFSANLAKRPTSETEKTLDLFKETFLVPTKACCASKMQRSETYLKKLHLFETKKLLQNQFASLINSFPIDLVEKSEAIIEKDKNSHAGNKVLRIPPPPTKTSSFNWARPEGCSTTHSNELSGNKSLQIKDLSKICYASDYRHLVDVTKKVLAVAECGKNTEKGVILPPALQAQYVQNKNDNDDVYQRSVEGVSTNQRANAHLNELPLPSLYKLGFNLNTPLGSDTTLLHLPRALLRGFTRAFVRSDVACAKQPEGVLPVVSTKTSSFNWARPSGLTELANQRKACTALAGGCWGTEIDRLTQLFAYSTIANTANAEGLDPLLLLNTLGFTFNNFSLLTNPPILLSYDKGGYAQRGKGIFDLYRYISFYVNPKNNGGKLDWVVFQHSTNDKFNLLLKKIASEVNKEINTLPLRGRQFNGQSTDFITSNQPIITQFSEAELHTDLILEFLRGRTSLSYVDPSLLVQRESVVSPHTSSLYKSLQIEDLSPILHFSGASPESNKSTICSRRNTNSAALFGKDNYVDTKGANNLKISFKQKEIKIETLNKINVVDKDINFDKKSRYMSGYVYPDIAYCTSKMQRSNSLKAFLYEWLSKNKHFMPWFSSYYHHLNDKPIADSEAHSNEPLGQPVRVCILVKPHYLKNLQNSINSTATGSVEIKASSTKIQNQRFSPHNSSLDKSESQHINGVSPYPERVHFSGEYTCGAERLQRLYPEGLALQIGDLYKPVVCATHTPIGVRGRENLLHKLDKSKCNSWQNKEGLLAITDGRNEANGSTTHSNEHSGQGMKLVRASAHLNELPVLLSTSNQFLRNNNYIDNIEVPYKKFNHYLAKFPGFSDSNQFFTTLPQISCGNENLVNDVYLEEEFQKKSIPTKRSVGGFNATCAKQPEEVLLQTHYFPDEPRVEIFEKVAQPTKMNNAAEFPRGPNRASAAEGYKRSASSFQWSESNDSRLLTQREKGNASNIIDKSEINKKFIQKNGCDPRKVAYSGIVVRRNEWTKDFQPFKDLTSPTKMNSSTKMQNQRNDKSLQIKDLSIKDLSPIFHFSGDAKQISDLLPSRPAKMNSQISDLYKLILVEQRHKKERSKERQAGVNKSSIWGTFFLGPENPLTDRQCHFFGQKQLSTLDTNSLQRDYLRQLGKEILTQSNSKSYTELLPLQGTSIERTKILSLSKKVNSFFFKKRKYSYLLEPKDQWHLLFQEQLATALEDCKKYPLSTIHSFEETNIEKFKLGSGRIKVSAPLVMARFPKKLVQSRSSAKIAHYPSLLAQLNFYPSGAERVQSYASSAELGRSSVAPVLTPRGSVNSFQRTFKENLDYYHISYNKSHYEREKWYKSACAFTPLNCFAQATGKLVQQASSRASHYPLFTERFSEEINAIPYLNKNSLFYVPAPLKCTHIPQLRKPCTPTGSSLVGGIGPLPLGGIKMNSPISDLSKLVLVGDMRISPPYPPAAHALYPDRVHFSGGVGEFNLVERNDAVIKNNNLVGVQNMCTSLLIQEPLNCNSWAVLNQWIFLIALLFWVEETLLNNVFPALFALEQILLNAAGLRTGENNRTHALRISKNETPKFQNLAGIDGLLGELSELVLFLRGQRNVGIMELNFWNKWNKKNSYGVLLTGSPGTGKTFLVRALANEAKVPVLILSASTLIASKLNNNKPSWSIRHAFKRAKQLAPCILFIDEIDALGKSRGKIVTDINEIVVDTSSPSLNASFLTLTKSTHRGFASAQQMFSYEQFGQNCSNFNATLLNKWEYPLQSTILQESNEINQNSLCEDKLVDLLKIAGGIAQGSYASPRKRSTAGRFTPTEGMHFTGVIPSGKESPAEFKKESINETTYSRSEKGVQQLPALEKEMIRGKFGPLTQLLVSMDGVSNFSGVLIMGATNRPELLDPALTRPGRFEKTIRIDKPSEQNRIEILRLYSQNLGIQQQIPWSYLATRTIGLTTADLAVAMNYSSLRAIIQDSVHTLETIEYGLNCITRL